MEPITSKEFNALKKIVYDKFGIELKEEKITLIESRLRKVLADRGMNNLAEYLETVKKDNFFVLEQELAEKLTTNHTFFMREPRHFLFLKDIVLPYLKYSLKEKDLRIWSAGCSSGEEAYTIAMIIDEFFGYEKEAWDSKILATDISTAVLQKAVEGIYPFESIEDIPPLWEKKYFNRLNDKYVQVTEKTRNEVIFRYLNFAEDGFPFKKKFHVIFCRNVMIYFDQPMKDRLIKKFYHCIEPGGYLLIGHSESLGKGTHGFKYVKPSIYKK